jgi:hypothetical protein
LVSALLGMSLVAAGLLDMYGSQILPLGQWFLGANVPMAALVLGVGFLVAAAEPAVQTTFVRLAIIYAVASIFFQVVGGSQIGNHTLVQGIVIPVLAAILLIVLHPEPRLIVPTSGTTRPTTTLG